VYHYKMVEIPANVIAKFGRGGNQIGPYLEKLANEWSELGWEFSRLDFFTIYENAGCGCLGFFLTLLGQPTTREIRIGVITFRAPKAAPSTELPSAPT